MKYFKNNSGVSIIATVLVMLLLALFGAVVVTLVTTGANIGVQEEQGVQAFYIAEGGLEYILENRTFPNYSTQGATINLGAGNFRVDTPTYLTANITDADVIIPVQSTANFPASGRIVIDSELIDYTGTTPTSFTGATRGVGGTVAAAHTSGNAVYPATTVTVNPGVGGNTIDVVSTTGFLIPGIIKIDSEYIYCAGATPTTFTNCIRGYLGTTRTGHVVGSTVFQYIVTSTGTISTAGMSVQRVVSAGLEGSITFDNATRDRGGGSSLTWSHTVSGSNRILIVGVSIRNNNNQTVTSVTYGEIPLSFLGARDNGTSVRVELWYRVSPPTGTNSIVVTLSAAANVVGGAVSLTGVAQTDPDISNFTSGTSTTPSVTVTTDVNGAWVIDTLAAVRGVDAAVGTGQIERWNWFTTGPAASRVRGAGSTEGPRPSGNVIMSWTLSKSREWAMGAVAVRPAGVTVLNRQERF